MIFSRITHSLSAKLLVLFIIAGMILILLVVGILGKGFSRHFRQSIQPFMIHYVQLLEEELGNPPKLEHARRITRNIPIDIHVYGPDQNWSTGGTRFGLDELTREITNHSEDHSRNHSKDFHGNHKDRHPRFFQRFRMKNIEDELLLQTKKGPYDIYFQLHHRRDIRHGGPFGLILLCTIIAILLTIYYATRRLFKPIDDINDGVRKFGEGNLKHRISYRRNDQLGTLAHNVNTMAQDIDNMLEAKRQLLLGISHELRSPLTRSKVNLALMPESSAHTEISRDIEMMEQLITELLESERLNSQHAALNPEKAHLTNLISEWIETNFSQSGVTSKLDRVEAYVDIARLKLLISNLLQNAIKHNGPDRQAPVIHLKSATFNHAPRVSHRR